MFGVGGWCRRGDEGEVQSPCVKVSVPFVRVFLGGAFCPSFPLYGPFPFLSFWASFLLARVPHGGPEAHGVEGGWNVCRGLDI